MSFTATDALPPAAPRRRRGFSFAAKSLPQLYARRMLVRILLQLGLLLTLIEAIFLGEKLTGILDSALQRSANIGDILALLAFTAPEVSDLALPLALLIAVYSTALTCREDREFLVLAGAGIGAHQIVRLVLLVGVAAQLFSLLLSGFIAPHARFGYRDVLFAAQYRALRGGITPGEFYFFGNAVVFAGSKAAEASERRVFIYQPRSGADRVLVADNAKLEGPDDQGSMTLHLRDFTVNDFANPRTDEEPAADAGAPGSAKPAACESCPPRGEPMRKLRIGTYAREMTISQLFHFDLRGYLPTEWSSLELLGIGTPPQLTKSPDPAELGRRLSRSILCLIGPLLALVALTFTFPRTQAFAMPLACGALLSLDLAVSAVVKMVSPAGVWWGLAPPIIVAAASLIVLTYYTAQRQYGIVRPALGRL
jgi:lipopolysaccharide export LptBFGC system permease protein LptF